MAVHQTAHFRAINLFHLRQECLLCHWHNCLMQNSSEKISAIIRFQLDSKQLQIIMLHLVVDRQSNRITVSGCPAHPNLELKSRNKQPQVEETVRKKGDSWNSTIILLEQ